MKYLDEYRETAAVQALQGQIASSARRPWSIMEVCGGQTHSILRHGIDRMLPPTVELLHGPGCPVCVTPVEMIDRAHAIAGEPGVIFCSFGDMLRVPGSRSDLLALKARGADIRVVYSPLDALRLAIGHPDRRVVLFASGFETTAPANAMAAWQARRLGVRNFSLLVSQVLVPPMLTSILQSPGNRVQAFLGPGHVCTITGTAEYAPIAARYGVPIVITGFEPLDLLDGILRVVRQLEAGRATLENAYERVVLPGGSPAGRALLEEVFEVCDRSWRGLGVIAKSGFRLRHEYRDHDAERLFPLETREVRESDRCISGQILRGLRKPLHCPSFGKDCTPESPLGATMVSSEGACAAYYAYGRHRNPSEAPWTP
jgi:hydrogenase expression/formation protein HypD